MIPAIRGLSAAVAARHPEFLATPTRTEDPVSMYETLAPAYDERYSSEECEDENARVEWLAATLLTMAEGTGVLDIGAGTGLALDLGIAAPGDYLAIEPASAMAAELRKKWPTAPVLVQTYGEYRPAPADPVALTLALFGVASYLSPRDLRRISRRTRAAGGAALLMAYAPGYYPGYYDEEPVSAEPARRALSRLKGARHLYTLNEKYEMWVIR